MQQTMTMFVYGTLRQGEALYPLLSGSMIRRTQGTIKGKLYAHKCGVYPVADLEDEGTIVGDLLTVHMTEAVQDTIRMEHRAGYRAMQVVVQTRQGKVKALAFHYEGIGWGEAIPSGDWFDYEGSDARRDWINYTEGRDSALS